MRKKLISAVTIGVSILIIVHHFRGVLKEIAFGQDYTYNFNSRREQLQIPELPREWKPVFLNRRKNESQYWRNPVPDTINPTYSQKDVIVEGGEIQLEADQYENIKKKQKLEVAYYYNREYANWEFVLYDRVKMEKRTLTEDEARELLISWKLEHPKLVSTQKD